MGEGGADREFFAYLTASRGLDKFQATCATGGKTTFWQRLRAIKASSRVEKISTLVLARDSNGDPDEALKDLQRQIKQVGGYGVPTEVRKVAKKTSGLPAVAALLLPSDKHQGNLETLILEAFKDEWPAEAALAEEFIGKSPTGKLDTSKRSKALLSCMVAAVGTADPSCAVSQMWKGDKGFQHLLGKKCFDPIVDFLKTL